MPDKNYYRILQVDPEAEPEVVQSAYRRLAQLYHPDVSKAHDAGQRMRDLNEAWAVLREPETRRRYDEHLASQRSATSGASRPRGATGREEDDRPYTRAGSEGRGGEQSAAAPEPPHAHRAAEADAPFPTTCQRCHRSDTTLRVSSFPWVISIVILTFRRAWGGVYCEHCRSVMMTRAKLLTFLLGWWGIPFGPIFSLSVLFSPSQGAIPADLNGAYLAALGLHFAKEMRLNEAARAWELSLAYAPDSRIAALYEKIFSHAPARLAKPSSGALGGASVGLSCLALVLWLFLGDAASFQPRSSARSVDTPVAQRTWSTSVVMPTVKAVPSLTPRPTTNGDGVSTTESRRVYYSRGGFSIEVPATYDVEEYIDPEDPSIFGITVSDDGKVGPYDATIDVMALPMPGYFADMTTSELRGEALRAVADASDDDPTWHQLTQATVRFVLGGALAEASARWDSALTNGDAAYVRHAVILTDDWAHIVFVSGSDSYHTPVNEYFERVIGSFQVTP